MSKAKRQARKDARKQKREQRQKEKNQLFAEEAIKNKYEEMVAQGMNNADIAIALDALTSSLGTRYGITDELNNVVSKLLTGYTGPELAQKYMQEARDLLTSVNAKSGEINTFINTLSNKLNLSAGNSAVGTLKYAIRKDVKDATNKINKLTTERDSLYDKANSNVLATNEAAAAYSANPTNTNRIALQNAAERANSQISSDMKGIETNV